MIAWLSENKEWLFSGAGVVFIGWLGTYFINDKQKSKNIDQKITSGENSQNYQSGGDMNISGMRDKDEK